MGFTTSNANNDYLGVMYTFSRVKINHKAQILFSIVLLTILLDQNGTIHTAYWYYPYWRKTIMTRKVWFQRLMALST